MNKNLLRTTLLMAASMGALMSHAAYAQDSGAVSIESTQPTQPEVDPTKDKDIVVTGTRAALETSERIKRDAPVILDGVSANDIGALPDASMSEAVIRIPGAYANDNGALSARGLGPDFIQQLFNGRVIPSPAPTVRRVQTGSFPTEGITGLFLQKTPEASTIEGGAGGTILLETIHPLESSQSGLNVVIRGYTNTVSAKLSDAQGYNDMGPRVSATYVKRFNGNFGFAFTYAHATEYKANLQNDGSAWRLGTLTRTDLNADGRLDALPQTLGVQTTANNDFRDSVISMAQWDITPALRASLDGFFNNDRYQNHTRRYFAFQLFQGGPGTSVTTSTVNQYDTVTAFNGTSGGYRGIVNFTDGTDRTYGGGLNLAYDDKSRVSFKVDASYFKATRRAHNPNFTFENDSTSSVVAGQRLPFSYDLADPRHSTYNFQLLSADDFALANGSIGDDHVDDSIGALRSDFTYKFGDSFFRSIDVGARVDWRHKTSRPLATNYTFGLTNAADPASTVNYNLRPDLDQTFVIDGNPIGNKNPFVSGANVGNWPFFDLSKLIGLTSAPGTNATIAASVVNGYIDDEEDTKALYGQLNFETGILSGNIGLRYVLTGSTIKGLQGSLTSNSLQTIKANYNYFLPELNTKLDITSKLLLRLSLSKTISRPNYGDSKVAASFNTVTALQNGFATVTAGNPFLRPYVAKGIDSSLEWYPDHSTSVTLGAFIKYVDGFLRQVTQNGTVLVNGQTLPAQITTQINDTATKNFAGIELSARKELTFLPGFLSGLGVYVNWDHSFTTAHESIASLLMQPAVDVSPNNFAKDIVNAQLYYSKGPVDIRLVYRYFATNTQTLLAPANYREIPSGTLDISAGYSVNKHVRLLFSMTNLVYDGAYQFTPDFRYPGGQYTTNRSLLLNTTDVGQVIQAGVRFSF